jgi:nucleotide-binding universal stress UspA family protein
MKIMKKQVHDREYRKLKKQLSLINSKGVEGSVVVIEGTDIVQKILTIRRKKKPYIVIVGSKRLKQRGRLSRIRFFGSIARRLSEESSRPILIVK